MNSERMLEAKQDKLPKLLAVGVAAVMLLVLLTTNGQAMNESDLSRPKEMKIEKIVPRMGGQEEDAYGSLLLTKQMVNDDQAGVPSNCTTGRGSKICIGGWRNYLSQFAYSSFVVKRSGVITGVKLTYLSGKISILKGNAAYEGRWGYPTAPYALSIFVTRSDAQKTVMFPVSGTEGYEKTHFPRNYKLTKHGNSVNGDVLTLMGPQYYVRQGEEIRFWTGYNLWPYANGDDAYQTCATVELIYDMPPNSICLGGSQNYLEDFGYSTFVVKKTGTIVGVKLHWISGTTSVGGASTTHIGRFGSTYTGFFWFLTDGKKNVMYPMSGTEGYETTGHFPRGYKLVGHGNSINGDVLTLMGPQYHVKANEELRFYQGYNLWPSGNGDDRGQTCVRVELVYDNAIPLCSDFGNQASCVANCKCAWNSQIKSCSCSTAPKDFVFLVDGSGSINPPEAFTLQKQMVNDMIRYMVPANSGVGVMQFSSMIQTEIALFPRATKQQVISAVTGMSQLMEGTYMGEAIRDALTNQNMLANQGTRSGSWIVLVTDGKSNGVAKPCDYANTIKSRGLHVLILGITQGFDAKSLECLVAHEVTPAKHIIQMQTYSRQEFQRVAPKLDEQICSFK